MPPVFFNLLPTFSPGLSEVSKDPTDIKNVVTCAKPWHLLMMKLMLTNPLCYTRTGAEMRSIDPSNFAASSHRLVTHGRFWEQQPTTMWEFLFFLMLWCIVCVYGWIDVWMDVWISARIYLWIYVCMDGWMNGCMYVCICVCKMYEYKYNQYIYVWSYMCTQTHIYITCVCPLSASAMRLRLVTTAEFIEVNGASPITQIAGFSPWRTFLWIYFSNKKKRSTIQDFVAIFWNLFMFGIQGIYPDLLHILDLALYTDMIASTFLEWSEPGIFEGRSRDDRLLKLFAWYREWCRENRSLFFGIVGNQFSVK